MYDLQGPSLPQSPTACCLSVAPRASASGPCRWRGLRWRTMSSRQFSTVLGINNHGTIYIISSRLTTIYYITSVFNYHVESLDRNHQTATYFLRFVDGTLLDAELCWGAGWLAGLPTSQSRRHWPIESFCYGTSKLSAPGGHPRIRAWLACSYLTPLSQCAYHEHTTR